MGLKLKIVIFLVVAVKSSSYGWGFTAHKHINRQAVYSLPEGSFFGFMKKNIEYLSANAINPDKRRYTVEGEACKHYIDLDMYDTSRHSIPKYLDDAERKYSKDTLNKHGILPWHIFKMKLWLTKAITERNYPLILKVASDLGHYIADANVPLHTTHNYDGQFTNQKGIHALWETRVPELFSYDYNLWVGKAEYIDDPQALAWNAIRQSHAAVDSVLKTEATLTLQFPEDQKYAFEELNGKVLRQYSKEFSQKYTQNLNGQVERQMQRSIKMVADIWYTCWIDAGQPELEDVNTLSPEDIEEQKENIIKNERFLESHNCEDHQHRNLYLTKTE